MQQQPGAAGLKGKAACAGHRRHTPVDEEMLQDETLAAADGGPTACCVVVRGAVACRCSHVQRTCSSTGSGQQQQQTRQTSYPSSWRRGSST